MMRTDLKTGNLVNIRHPREGGGPLKTMGKMDSRLRGNDYWLSTYYENEL
jgi:hypothetical protein